MFMYMFTHNLLPQVFSSFFTSVRDTHSHSTRSSTNLFVPFTRTSYSMNTIRFLGPRVWNAIDESIRFQRSVGLFKLIQTSPYLSLCVLASSPKYLFSSIAFTLSSYLHFVGLLFLLNSLSIFSYYFNCLCHQYIYSVSCQLPFVLSLVCLSFFVCVILSVWLFLTSFCLYKQPPCSI